MARKASRQPPKPIDVRVRDALTIAFSSIPRIQTGWWWAYGGNLSERTTVLIYATRLGKKNDGVTVDMYAAVEKAFKLYRLKNPFAVDCDVITNWEPSMVTPSNFLMLKRSLDRERRVQNQFGG